MQSPALNLISTCFDFFVFLGEVTLHFNELIRLRNNHGYAKCLSIITYLNLYYFSYVFCSDINLHI